MPHQVKNRNTRTDKDASGFLSMGDLFYNIENKSCNFPMIGGGTRTWIPLTNIYISERDSDLLNCMVRSCDSINSPSLIAALLCAAIHDISAKMREAGILDESENPFEDSGA